MIIEKLSKEKKETIFEKKTAEFPLSQELQRFLKYNRDFFIAFAAKKLCRSGMADPGSIHRLLATGSA